MEMEGRIKKKRYSICTFYGFFSVRFFAFRLFLFFFLFSLFSSSPICSILVFSFSFLLIRAGCLIVYIPKLNCGLTVGREGRREACKDMWKKRVFFPPSTFLYSSSFFCISEFESRWGIHRE